ncbi:MAG TPA: hypothetical protein VFF30_04990 [Nitrososphaerales archaeon]|nr:hypothetical protein [Nitrososphaerales archaeon]
MPSRKKVAIVGVGISDLDPLTAGYSTKELMFQAAKRAYSDADIDARSDVGSFICCAEDFWEGISITDEYAPDQIGAKLRPLLTVSGDGLLGLAHGYMHILAGVSDIVVVESHSKLSDVVSKQLVEELGYDPTYGRPKGVGSMYLAGMEMRRYLHESGNTEEDSAAVVTKNKNNALRNPRASYGSKISIKEVLESEEVASPLKKVEVSDSCDGSVVMVLASARQAPKFTEGPVWIDGISWFSDSPNLEEMDLGQAAYASYSAMEAYEMAGITRPSSQLDFAELDDTFAYKELEHIDSLGLTGPTKKKKSGQFVSSGKADPDGALPINVSGGSLGMGYFVEATSLVRAHEAVLQLRGQAGSIQLSNPRKCVVQSWRGIPTQTGVTAIFSK